MDKIQPSANNTPKIISKTSNPSSIIKKVEFLNDNDLDDNSDVDGNGGNGSSTSRLTPELIIRAEKEVNEKEAWRLRDIEALREIIRAEPSLRCRLDDAFLLRFLRARRFDYDGAFRLICDYYQLYTKNPELFIPLEQLKCVFETNCLDVLDGRSKNDETIFLLRLGQWNPRKFSFDNIIAASIISMEYLIRDEITQINGIICIIDMSGFGWSQLRKFGPSQAKKVIHILDKCLPIRLKTIFVINESTLADIGFAIMRPFTSEELHEKIIFLGSNFQQSLQQNISLELLPEEFGGRNGFQMNSEQWFKKLLKFEKEMKRNFYEYGFLLLDSGGNNNLIVDLNGGNKCSNSSNGMCRGSYSRDSSGNYSGPDMKTFFRKSQTCNGYLFDYYNTTTSVD